jgi:hypothetical protein
MWSILYVVVGVATWAFLRSFQILAPLELTRSPKVITLSVDFKPPTVYLTREQGLAKLDELIERKRIPDNCDDVMRFLEDFKRYKDEWGVNGSDLQRLYMQKCSLWELTKQWKLTMDCCWDYRSYID